MPPLYLDVQDIHGECEFVGSQGLVQGRTYLNAAATRLSESPVCELQILKKGKLSIVQREMRCFFRAVSWVF